MTDRNLEAVLDLDESSKIIDNTRITYQIEVDVELKKGSIHKAIPYTFEDALILSNFNLFKSKSSDFIGMLKNMCAATHKDNIDDVCEGMFKALSGTKAVMALDILYEVDIEKLVVPNYIDEGLNWLANELANTSTGEISEL